jgi:hypothetical protein
MNGVKVELLENRPQIDELLRPAMGKLATVRLARVVRDGVV